MKLFLFHYSGTSPLRPGVFRHAAYFSSREVLARQLARWSWLGYKYFETADDRSFNDQAEKVEVLEVFSTGHAIEKGYTDDRPSDGINVMRPKDAAHWADRYRVSVEDFCQLTNKGRMDIVGQGV